MSHDLSLPSFHQSQFSWSGFHHFDIDSKFGRNNVFTIEGEHDFRSLRLTTFKARLRVVILLQLWLKKFSQLRVTFTNEDVAFTFEVDFFYIFGWFLHNEFFFTLEVVTMTHVLLKLYGQTQDCCRVIWQVEPKFGPALLCHEFQVTFYPNSWLFGVFMWNA